MHTSYGRLSGFVIILVFLFLVSESQAAPELKPVKENRGNIGLTIGGGFGFVHGEWYDDPSGFSGGLGLAYYKGRDIYTLRWVLTSEFELNLFDYDNPPDEIWDVGLLYGRITRAPYGFASIAGGAGLVGISHHDKTSYYFGVPLEGRVFWTPVPFAGIGVCGFGNLNTERSFVGFLFCLQIILPG